MARSGARKKRLHGGRVILTLLVLGVAYLVSLFIHVCFDGRRDERRPADVIIVLGASQANGRPNAVLKARLDHALDLYRDGYAPYLLFTGGKQEGDRYTEAETGRRYALARGVPDSAIFLEDTSNSTWQQVQSSADIMRKEHLRRAILVSDWFHAFRLRRMAHDLGMQTYFSPVPRSAIKRFSSRAFDITREVGAYALYRLVGK